MDDEPETLRDPSPDTETLRDPSAGALEPKVWGPPRRRPWIPPPDWEEEARIRREQEREHNTRIVQAADRVMDP